MPGAWSHIEVAKKPVAIYAPSAAKPRLGTIFLHSEAGESLQGHDAYTELFDQHNMVCLCPQVKRSWWLDRICLEFDPELTPEQHLLKKILPIFDELWGIKPRSIGVFGIGMGGQGALRLAFRHPQLFPVCAGIASALDFHELYGEGTPLDDMFDSREQCRQATAILEINPTQYPPHIFFAVDPDDEMWARGNDRLHEKLSAIGVPHTADLTTQAGGHSWPYFERMAEPALRFLYEALEKESRRLL